MAFVKLDCGILNSTLWVERVPREIFITALLMAVPHEVTTPLQQIAVRSLKYEDFMIPPGLYGFVAAAGPGIVRMAMADADEGIAALERLGAPDPESRTPDFDGRRLVRVDGGYIVLNFFKYRDKDNTAAERARRYRLKKALTSRSVTRDTNTVTRDSSPLVTNAEAEAEAEAKRQRKKEKAPASPAVSVSDLIAAGFSEHVAAEFIAHKAQRKAPLTARAWADHQSEAMKAGWTSQQAAEKVMAKGWKGFEAKYVAEESRQSDRPSETAWQRSQRELVEQMTGGLVSAKPPGTRSKTTEVIDVTSRILD